MNKRRKYNESDYRGKPRPRQVWWDKAGGMKLLPLAYEGAGLAVCRSYGAFSNQATANNMLATTIAANNIAARAEM